MSEEIGNLTLTRKQGETVTIGDDVTVTVSRIYSNYIGECVQLCIRAPKSLEVHRQEIWEKVQREKSNDER